MADAVPPRKPSSPEDKSRDPRGKKSPEEANQKKKVFKFKLPFLTKRSVSSSSSPPEHLDPSAFQSASPPKQEGAELAEGLPSMHLQREQKASSGQIKGAEGVGCPPQSAGPDVDQEAQQADHGEVPDQGEIILDRLYILLLKEMNRRDALLQIGVWRESKSEDELMCILEEKQQNK